MAAKDKEKLSDPVIANTDNGRNYKVETMLFCTPHFHTWVDKHHKQAPSSQAYGERKQEVSNCPYYQHQRWPPSLITTSSATLGTKCDTLYSPIF